MPTAPNPADVFESWFRYDDTDWQPNTTGISERRITRPSLVEACNYMSAQHVAWQVRGSLSGHVYAEKAQNSPDWFITNDEPELSPEPEGERKEVITARITRPNGRLTLEINAKDFHDILDSIGVRHDGTKYLDTPATDYAVVDGARFIMSTNCLLKREYPAKFDMSGIWVNPPKFESLKAVCESAYAQARKILDHYQPIDISIDIQKKIVK